MLAAVLVATLGLVVGAQSSAYADDEEVPAGTSYLHDKSAAANLYLNDDGDLVSDVTLTWGPYTGDFDTDVVFVLDVSDDLVSTINTMQSLVERLQQVQTKTGATINVGVVVFNGSAAALWNGEMKPADEAVEALGDFASGVQAAAAEGGYTRARDALESYLETQDVTDYIKRGSNLHSGLLAADKMLANREDPASDARTYLLTVTDGMVYFWGDEDGNVYTSFAHVDSGQKSWEDLRPWSAIAAEHGAALWSAADSNYSWTNVYGITLGASQSGLSTHGLTDKFYSTDSAQGGTGGWDGYMAGARARIKADDEDSSANYVLNAREYWDKIHPGQPYGESVDIYQNGNQSVMDSMGVSIIPYEDLDKHALSADRAIVYSYDEYVKLASQYRAYAYSGGFDSNTWPELFVSKLNEAAGVSGDVDFASFTDAVLYQLGAGSSLVDTIGYVDGDYDFEFIDPEDMQMQVTVTTPSGTTTTYNAVEIAVNHWGIRPVAVDDEGAVVYGDDGLLTDDPTSSTYAYEVIYKPGTGTDEQLVWQTNVNVSNFEKVDLTYRVKLTNPKTVVGTYGTYDPDGTNNDGTSSSLYVYNSAILNPVDSEGNPGNGEPYAKPTVSYVVIGATKDWSDGADAHTGDSVVLAVLDSAGEQVSSITLDASGSWTGTKALPATDKDGNAVSYTVEETETSATGYTATYGGSQAEGFTVTNTATDSGDNGSGTDDNGSGTSTTTTTTKAGRTLPFTGDPATLAGVLATLAAGSGVLAVGVRRRGRR